MGVEQAYRIIVDEIPQPDNKAEPAIGLKLQMRYSIPLLSMGRDPDKQRGAHHAFVDTHNLSWRVKMRADSLTEVNNRGDVHVRLSQVSLVQGGQKRPVAEGLLGYVLAGSTRSWAIPAGIRQPDQMRAQINAEDEQWQSTPVN